ncbi:MAG: ABC transporter [Legionellales bacterium]|nr:ABC transporter [Legionellales bacterium]
MDTRKVALGFLLVGLTTGLAGCSTIELISKERAPNPEDPYEPLNRDIYAFNRFMDRNLLKPAAKGYSAILPGAMQRGINNFFNNLRMIPTVLNDVLQWKWSDAADDGTRLLINSTVGVIGFYDWATGWGYPAHYEDFGQTLATWGFEESAFLMLPLMGPSTLRDGAGIFVDRGYLSIWPYIDDDRVYYGLLATETIDDRAALLSSERVAESATDEYALVRSAYLQKRAHQIRDGQVPEEEDDYYNDPFADMDE